MVNVKVLRIRSCSPPSIHFNREEKNPPIIILREENIVRKHGEKRELSILCISYSRGKKVTFYVIHLEFSEKSDVIQTGETHNPRRIQHHVRKIIFQQPKSWLENGTKST